ncbi:endoglucanase [Histoplasma capsulatum H143]|uniref:Endoglucanase n=1 Tax=Ajellomyces capsulatus (strain H143) TaxID=544712 RepID=C6HNZ9_AJECH|nr:endoglucanase [Histoplasma capsulatum H143]
MHSLSLLYLIAAAGSALGHIEMSEPVPFRSRFGSGGDVDYSMTSPLLADGSNFPCKGYQHDSVSKPSATYKAGGSGEIKLAGTATHGGGSCQISLSYDQGKTFKVIESIIGGCPLPMQYSFKIPSSAPSGEALLAWTWFNKIGNREMYMNCAPVSIEGGSGDKAAFDKLPDIYVANVGNGKTTIEGQDVVFPNPGDDTTGTDKPSGDAPAGSSAAGNASAPAAASGAASTPDASPAASPTPAANTPAANTPAANTPAANSPAANTPAANTPAATTPALQINANAASSAAETPSPSESAPASESTPSDASPGIGGSDNLRITCNCSSLP